MCINIGEKNMYQYWLNIKVVLIVKWKYLQWQCLECTYLKQATSSKKQFSLSSSVSVKSILKKKLYMSNKRSINVKLCALSVKCLTLNSMINLEKAFSFYHCLTNALTVSHIYKLLWWNMYWISNDCCLKQIWTHCCYFLWILSLSQIMK